MNKIALLGLSVFFLLMLSCGRAGDKYSMVVEVNTGQLLMDAAINPDDAKFTDILDAALAKSISGEDIIEAFFAEAEDKYPNLRMSSLFRFPKEDSRPNWTNKEVLAYFQNEQQQSIDATSAIIETRLESDLYVLGIKKDYANNQLIFELDGVQDTTWLLRRVQQRAKLAFYSVYALQEVSYALNKIDNAFEEDSRMQDRLSDYITPYTDFTIGTVHPRHKERVEALISYDPVKNYLPTGTRLKFGELEHLSSDSKELGYPVYACRIPYSEEESISNADVQNASVGFNEYDQNYTIDLSFTPNGADKWAKMTRENVNRCIALEVNETIVSAPMVISEITGGNTRISGNYSKEEASELAHVLNIGTLPVGVRIVSLKKQ